MQFLVEAGTDTGSLGKIILGGSVFCCAALVVTGRGLLALLCSELLDFFSQFFQL